MRSLLLVGLSLVISASAHAATVHRSQGRGHAAIHHEAGPLLRVDQPRQPADPRFPPVLQDQTPSYDDPSKWGGG